METENKKEISSNFPVICRASVKWFATKMEEKLADNDHKGGWADCETGFLFRKLEEELQELYLALHNRERGSFFGTTHTDEEIVGECADIANFVMMIADKFGAGHGR